jgi:hypothetical protein
MGQCLTCGDVWLQSAESALLAKVQLMPSTVQAKFPSSIKNGAGVLVCRLQGAIAHESLVLVKYICTHMI